MRSARAVGNSWKSRAELNSKRQRTRSTLRAFVQQWVHDNTTPSSNTRNVVVYKRKRELQQHVIHWRTDTLSVLYSRFSREAYQKLHLGFKPSFFYNCIPFYVRLKYRQDGLCPLHYTGISLGKETVFKRSRWHRKCKCTCVFCSTAGCSHGQKPLGGICAHFTCERCRNVKCPHEWTNTRTLWKRPVQKKRTGGGIYWTDETVTESRADMMATMQKEMSTFAAHSQHVTYAKEQSRSLLENLPHDEIVIKADFIQNIVHDRGRETSQSYYGKRQTQFLCFVVWYYSFSAGVPTLTKEYFDYLSSYLKHNSLFFQKCLLHLLVFLETTIGVHFRKVRIGAPIYCILAKFDNFLGLD